ncbi:MAG: response regulator transcription factor [Actinomycetota bacterium]
MPAAADRPLVAVVDDDPLFAEILAGNLADRGYGTSLHAGGAEFLAAMAAGLAPALVLLDWKMPGLTGIDVLRRLREGGGGPPVIFLTVLSDQIFEEAALLGGATDFVEKSRSFAILERRIDLILAGRRAAEAAAAPAAGRTVGALALDPGIRRARWRDRPVELTLAEFAMVELLAARHGRDVSYRELYDAARGKGFHAGQGDGGYRANVRAAIKRIREKFKAVDDDFQQIGNYPGFGYRWLVGDA